MASLDRSLSYITVRDYLNNLRIPHTIENGGKHPKVRFTNALGRNCMVVVSSSPSDQRVAHNARKQVMAQLALAPGR
jgi:hypothetical protein